VLRFTLDRREVTLGVGAGGITVAGAL
jgi:hypothetical protein